MKRAIIQEMKDRLGQFELKVEAWKQQVQREKYKCGEKRRQEKEKENCMRKERWRETEEEGVRSEGNEKAAIEKDIYLVFGGGCTQCCGLQGLG